MNDDDFVAYAQHYREEHEATHGEAEQCGGPCIVLGLDEPAHAPDDAAALAAARLVAGIRQQVAIGAEQQSREAVLNVLDRILAALPSHPPAPPASTDDWTRLRAGVADAWAAVAERYGKPASAAEVGAAVEADATTDLNADSDRALHRLRYDRRALLNVIGVLLAAPPATLPLDSDVTREVLAQIVLEANDTRHTEAQRIERIRALSTPGAADA